MFLKSINTQLNGVSPLWISYLLKPFILSLSRNFKNLCLSIGQNWITQSPRGFAARCSRTWEICDRSMAGVSLFLFLHWNLPLRKSFPAAAINGFMVVDDTNQSHLNPFQFLTQTTIVPSSSYVNLYLFVLSSSTTCKMIFFFLLPPCPLFCGENSSPLQSCW